MRKNENEFQNAKKIFQNPGNKFQNTLYEIHSPKTNFKLLETNLEFIVKQKINYSKI